MSDFIPYIEKLLERVKSLKKTKGTVLSNVETRSNKDALESSTKDSLRKTNEEAIGFSKMKSLVRGEDVEIDDAVIDEFIRDRLLKEFY